MHVFLSLKQSAFRVQKLRRLDLKIHAFYVISVFSSYIIPEELKKQSNSK